MDWKKSESEVSALSPATQSSNSATAAAGSPSSSSPSEAPSRISGAIFRILAVARGATEGRRSVTTADLSPPRSASVTASASAGKSESQEAPSRLEWTLRMMQ